MGSKGKYELIDNFFLTENRVNLPVNYFLLRGVSKDYLKKETILVAYSSFYNTEEMRVGRMYKPISNVI